MDRSARPLQEPGRILLSCCPPCRQLDCPAKLSRRARSPRSSYTTPWDKMRWRTERRDDASSSRLVADASLSWTRMTLSHSRKGILQSRDPVTTAGRRAVRHATSDRGSIAASERLRWRKCGKTRTVARWSERATAQFREVLRSQLRQDQAAISLLSSSEIGGRYSCQSLLRLRDRIFG